MTPIILDSGILIASLLPDEPVATQAQSFLKADRTVTFNAPRLFRSEVGAVLRKAVFTKRITQEEGKSLLERALKAPVEFHEDDALITQAYQLAFELNQPRSYDAQYLALAQRLQGEFWTTDQTLVNGIQNRFSRIRWLGSFNSA